MAVRHESVSMSVNVIQSPLYERLGIDPQSTIALEHRLSALAGSLKGGIDPEICKKLLVSIRHHVVLAYYLLERHEEVKQHARALVAEAEDYLAGDWRDTYVATRWVADPTLPEKGYKREFVAGRPWCRREYLWMESFRDATLWALWLDDRAATLRLAEYPADDLREQEPDFGPADKAWRMWVASLLLGKTRQDQLSYEEVIGRSRSKKLRLLGTALRAVSEGDSPAFDKAISQCIRHHARTIPATRSLDDKLALDASIVFQIATRTGLSPRLSPNDRDYLVAEGTEKETKRNATLGTE
jgi:hypothetical protein